MKARAGSGWQYVMTDLSMILFMIMAAAVGEFLGPVLVLRRDDERGLARRALQAGRAQFDRLFGPGHAGVKLVASVVVMVVVVLSLVDGRHRVTAQALAFEQQAHGRLVGEPAQHHMRQFLQLRRDSLPDLGMIVAVRLRPPG